MIGTVNEAKMIGMVDGAKMIGTVNEAKMIGTVDGAKRKVFDRYLRALGQKRSKKMSPR